MYCQASQSTASRAKNNQPKSNKNIQLLISHAEPSQQHEAIIIQQTTAAKGSLWWLNIESTGG